MSKTIQKIIGIYCITSPSSRKYVGQSRNICGRHDSRWEDYKKKGAPEQTKLNNSFIKYGIQNHIFEILEECSIEQLNEREIYWGLLYDVVKNGLNLRLGLAKAIVSEETREKISKIHIGMTYGTEVKEKQSKTHKLAFQTGERVIWNKGIPLSQERKDHLSSLYKGVPLLPEIVEKISKASSFRKKKQCLYCDKFVDTGNYAKYHGENCKHNPNVTDEQRLELKLSKYVKCKYCDYVGPTSVIAQYHNERCKLKSVV